MLASLAGAASHSLRLSSGSVTSRLLMPALGRSLACTGFGLPSRGMALAKTAPLMTVEDVESLRDRGRPKNKEVVLQLNEHERVILNAAKKAGFLAAGQHCKAPVYNAYYKFCWETRRPYIAVDRDGLGIYVDASPVTGLAKSKRMADLDRTIDAFKAALKTQPPSLQLVNADTPKKQEAKILPGPFDGSNKSKIAETVEDMSEAFTLYSSGRTDSETAAAALVQAHCALFSLPTPQEQAAAAAQRAEQKRAVWRAWALRKLDRLSQDAHAVKNLRVAAGALEGFLKAKREGQLDGVTSAAAIQKREAGASA